MSLQVWLPLVKDYENYGISNLKFSNFRYIRFIINAKRGSDDVFIQLSRLDFLDEDGNLFEYPTGTTVTSSLTGYSSGESPINIIDGNVNTKFCSPWSAGGYITIALGNSETINIAKYSRFQWYTANDGSWRDPTSFTLQFSNDGVNFVNAAVVTNASITTTRLALAYTGNCFNPGIGKIGPVSYYNDSYNAGGLVSDKTINLGNKLTMCCWMKFDSLMSASALGGAMGGQHRYPSNTGMGLSLKYISSTTGYLSCNTGNGNDRTYNTYCGGTLLNANTWYHVGFSYDGSTIKFYVNGKLDGTHTYTGQLNIDDYIILGSWSLENTSGPTLHNNYKLLGNINDFRIYDNVLSLKQIREISKGLVAHYQLKNMGQPNYLKGSGKYTKANPLVRKASINIGNLGDAYIYHPNNDLQVIIPSQDIYTLSCETKALPVTHNPGNIHSSSQGLNWFFRKGSDHWAPSIKGIGVDGRRYWTLSLPAGTYDLRSNLYSSDGADYTIEMYNIKITQGYYNPNDLWCPHEDDLLYNYLELGKGEEIDHSGYKNHGVRNRNIESISDSPRYNSCYQFTGNEYIACGRGSMVQDAITVNVWGHMQSWADYSNRRMASCTEGGGWNLEPGGESSDNGICFAVGTVSTSGNSYHNATSSIPCKDLSSGWHMFTGTYDGYTTKIYIDGVLSGSSSTKSSKALINYNASNGVFLGAEAASSATTPGGQYFNGRLSDFRVYGTALSAEDIKYLYEVGASVNEEGELFTYELQENNKTAIDSSGIVSSNSFSAATPTYDMEVKGLEDGSTWAKIHELDISTYKQWFANAAEADECNKNNRYSKLGIANKFINNDNTYEFMLTYPNMKKVAPAGYVELDYIEATGTQWINTGVTGTARWEFDMKFLETAPLIPAMTSNTAPSGQVSYWGGHNSGQEWRAYYAFDRDDSTMGDVWYGIGFGLATKIGYIFPSAQSKIKKIKLRAYIDGSANLYSGAIEYTTDGSNWYTLVPLTADNFTNNEDLYFDVNIDGLLGIRVGATSTSNNLGMIVRELQVYGRVTRRQLMGYGGSGQQYWGVQAHGGYGVHEDATLVGVAAGKRDSIVHSFGENGVYNIWVQNKSVNVTSSDVSSLQYQIFTIANSVNYTCHARLYRCKCIQNSVLVRDFVPVKRCSDASIGLYDLVNNVFYTNSGTGTFVAGYKKGLQPLEYIQNTGKNYIDTGYSAPEGFTMEATIYALERNGGYIIGSHNTAEPWGRNGVGFNGNGYWEIGTGDTCPASSELATLNTKLDIIASTLKGNSYFKINGSNKVSTTDSSSRSSNNVLVFSNQYTNYHGHTSSQVRLYSLKFYLSDGSLVRDYVPCAYAGEVGLYDKVTRVFYTKQGTGDFIAGPAVNSMPLYNRWTQTSSPHSASVSGFYPIFTSWPLHNGGLRKPGGSSLYNCDTGTTWYAALGQYSAWTDTQNIPAADGSSQDHTELWVRIDRLPKQTRFKIFNGAIGLTEFTEV